MSLRLNFAPAIASDNIKHSSDAEASTDDVGNYVLVKEIVIRRDMAGARVKFDLKAGIMSPVLGRIYKNDVAIGAERAEAFGVYTTFSEDFTDFVAGDKIQIYACPTGETNVAYVRNFRLCYDLGASALIVGGPTVSPSVPAWHAPDGFEDTMSKWSDEALAYDGNTGTYAYVAQNGNAWCDWCNFTFSKPILNASLFRIWWSKQVGATPFSVHVKAYGVGEETLVYSLIAQDQYVEVPVTLSPITYLAIRFQGQTVVTFNIQVNELALYGQI